jgi:PAB-dependent poly(A)-specific ribonuclease subunit 2
LDPHISRHTLVPLKVAYKKLRLLVDLGCVFIGHGLLKDFRIISKANSFPVVFIDWRPGKDIFVPRDQVIDTVDLYFLPERQRRLSLRFLTWFILKEDIQQDTHDSVEDAVSALRLYNAYEDFEERGVVEEKLGEAYRVGKQNVCCLNCCIYLCSFPT